MKNKKKPKILDNLGLKIIALVFAFFLCTYVTNYNDPIRSWNVSNVQVQLQHTNLITDQGQVYTVLDNTDVVPVVTVRAQQSIINTLQPGNITATADVEDITSLNTIEIHFASTKYNSEISSITGSISNVKLSIEARRTRSLTLTTATSGEVASGYQLGTITPEQNQVRISGPESVVSNIAKAQVTVDVSGATSSINTYGDIRLYDANDNQIQDTSNLTMNITSVKVSVQVLPMSEIPIMAQYQGTPAAGYLLSGVLTVDPSSVELSGKSSVLSTTQSIIIPADQLDITGRTETLTKTIDITPYIPSDLSIADPDFDGIVTVTVGIAPEVNTQVQADVSDIRLTNMPEGYEASVVSVTDGTTTAEAGTDHTTFSFQFSGLAEDVENIQAEDLSPSVDAGALISSQTLTAVTILEAPVNIVVPDNTTLTNTVTARVRIIPPGLTEDSGSSGTEAQTDTQTETESTESDSDAQAASEGSS